MNDIDFLPQSFHDARARRKRMLRHAVLLTCLTTTILSYYVLAPDSSQLESNVAAAEKYAESVRDEINLAAKLTLEREQLLHQLDVVHELQQPVGDAQVITAITQVMPASITITRMTMLAIRPTPAPYVVKGSTTAAAPVVKKSDEVAMPNYIRVEITGLAPNDQAITQFFAKLSESPMFANAKLASSKATQVGDLLGREYRINLEVPLDRRYRVASAQEVTGAP